MQLDVAAQTFEYGVAAGDPGPYSMLLWTRVTPSPSFTGRTLCVLIKTWKKDNLSTMTRRATFLLLDMQNVHPEKRSRFVLEPTASK